MNAFKRLCTFTLHVHIFTHSYMVFVWLRVSRHALLTWKIIFLYFLVTLALPISLLDIFCTRKLMHISASRAPNSKFRIIRRIGELMSWNAADGTLKAAIIKENKQKSSDRPAGGTPVSMKQVLVRRRTARVPTVWMEVMNLLICTKTGFGENVI